MIQTLSLEMSRHLSSLAPGFEGHWWWVKFMGETKINCAAAIDLYSDLKNKIRPEIIKICPAWQAEDVLRNLKSIFPGIVPLGLLTIAESFGSLLFTNSDTAYQEIEEYLLSVLK